MYRYRMELSYKGTRYRGWQRQTKQRSVQEVLENMISKNLKEVTTVHGCGRTDAGVHASQFFADFNSPFIIDFDFCFRINKGLPDDIVVKTLTPVPLSANAQLDAYERCYEYYIHLDENPLLHDTSAWYPREGLSVEKLKATAALIKGRMDFRSFCKQPDIYKHTFSNIFSNVWEETDVGLKYTIVANRFLRGMIRLLVGAQLEVAYGRMGIEEFKTHLIDKEPLKFYNFGHPQGLRLAGVKYK